MTLLRALFLAFLFPVFAAAQTFDEVLELHLMEVEAVVVDRAGKPVEGLTPADFEVLIDGKAIEVTNFYAGRPRERRAEAEKNPGPATESPLIVVIDDVHLTQAGRRRALAALRTYV